MDLSRRLALSYYKTIATLNEEHHIFLVQHQSTKKIYVKKILDVYNLDVYKKLYQTPIIGIPKLIDYFEGNDQLILIEDYISGESLQEKLNDSHLSKEDIIHYILDLCNILEQLHQMNPPVIHRDIKPSNLIITNYNRLILLDFNAAKQFSSTSETDTVLLGTKGYAAPEQYGFGSSSPQTDIYSIGILLKELTDASAEACSEFSTIIETCTQMNPSDRYASISDLKNALLAFTTSDNSEHKNISGKKQADFNTSFLPPGFRTHTPWKMLASLLGYLFALSLSLSLEAKSVNQTDLYLQKGFCFLMFLSIIFISFNYRDIQKFFPLCKHQNRILHYIGIVLFDIIIVFLLILVMILIENIYFHL